MSVGIPLGLRSNARRALGFRLQCFPNPLATSEGWDQSHGEKPNVIRQNMKLLGALLGGVLGLMIPIWLSQSYVAHGGDKTAAGAYSFLPLITIPSGIACGLGIATKLSQKK